MTDDLFAVPGYHTHLVGENDMGALQRLLEKCNDYMLLVDGHPAGPSAAVTLISERPEGKAVEDKVVLGIFSSNKELVGVLDAVKDYPRVNDWWIGLLLIDPIYRNQKVGKMVVDSFAKWAGRQGAKWIFLGVVEANENAYRFWRAAGFSESVRQPPKQFGSLTHVVITMGRALSEVKAD